MIYLIKYFNLSFAIMMKRRRHFASNPHVQKPFYFSLKISLEIHTLKYAKTLTM